MNAPFARWLDPDELERIHDDRIDMSDWLRANALPQHRATHEPSLLHVSALRVGIAFALSALLWAVFIVCAIYAASLWVLP